MTPTKLGEFIALERNHYPIEGNNQFASALGRAQRYEGFVRTVLDRFSELSRQHRAVMLKLSEINRRHMTEYPEGGKLISDQHHCDLLSSQMALNEPIHLETETFYLLAKVLLDTMARFLIHYFMPEMPTAHKVLRGHRAIKSHRGMCERFRAFSKAVGVSIPADFMERAQGLMAIIDVRDQEIAHDSHESRSEVIGTTWVGDGGDPKIHRMRGILYPKEGDVFSARTAEAPSSWIPMIDAYIGLYCELICRNRQTSRFMRAAPV